MARGRTVRDFRLRITLYGWRRAAAAVLCAGAAGITPARAAARCAAVALAYAKQGKWAQARDGFRRSGAAVATLPVELQRAALREEMRSDIAGRRWLLIRRFRRNVEILEPRRAQFRRIPHPGLRDCDDALGDDLGDGVAPVRESKHLQRRFVGDGHAFDIVRLKRLVLQQAIDRHGSPLP